MGTAFRPVPRIGPESAPHGNCCRDSLFWAHRNHRKIVDFFRLVTCCFMCIYIYMYIYIYIHICISYSSAKYTWLSISAAIIAVILTIVRYDHWSRVSIGMDYVLDLFILDVLLQVVDDVGWHSYYVQVYHYYYETKYIITITYIINYIIMYWIVIFLEATFPYSENLRIPCFHRIPDLGFGMLLW